MLCCCHRGKKYDQAIVDEVFDSFADEVATEERPLYFHTDDGSLRLLFVSLKGMLTDKKEIPSIFPWEVSFRDLSHCATCFALGRCLANVLATLVAV